MELFTKNQIDIYTDYLELKTNIWNDKEIQEQIMLAIKYRGWDGRCTREVKKLADMIQEKAGMEYEEYT